MITILLIILGAILVPAFAVLLSNTVHAPEGYEDVAGFHLAKEPSVSRARRRASKSKSRSARAMAHAIDLHVPAA
jgi:hypothetical protein